MDQEFEKPEDSETIVSGPPEEPGEDDFASIDDDLDSLREKSTRTSDVYDDLDDDGSALSRTLRGFSPTQRLILALLVFIDVLACACAILFIAGII